MVAPAFMMMPAMSVPAVVMSVMMAKVMPHISRVVVAVSTSVDLCSLRKLNPGNLRYLAS